MKTKLSLIILAFLLAAGLSLQSQAPLSLGGARKLARENYPLVKQRDLIKQSAEYSLKNAQTAWYPQVTLIGQATYQSDVITLPFAIPGQELEPPDKDQYRVYAEASQLLYDGGMTASQKEIIRANTEAEAQKVEVDLYRIDERVTDIYYGILLIDEQLNQVELLKKDIGLVLEKVNASIANGITLKSNGTVLEAELLKADQRTIELKAARSAYLRMLGQLVNRDLSEQTQLVKPDRKVPQAGNSRPETILFDLQQKTLGSQKKLINARNMPKANLFLQAGAGKPALNMLSNDFEPYAIGGLRISVPLSGFYTRKNDLNLLDLQSRAIDVQRETFLYNNSLELRRQQEEMAKYTALLQSDDALISLRESIKTASLAQLENGVINANDYLRELNAENLARQNRLLHELQMLLSIDKYNLTLGN